MSVLKIDNIDLSKIKFCDMPYLKKKDIIKMDTGEVVSKNIYYIDISHINVDEGNTKSLYIQLPFGFVRSVEGNVIKINIDNLLFIKELEDYIIRSVHRYSEKWFNNKKFTMNKIKNCIVTNYINECLNIVIGNNVQFYDKYKNRISIDDIKIDMEIIGIIRVANLQFIDNKFTYSIILEQGKLFLEECLIQYSILEDEENTLISISSSSSSSDMDDEYYKGTDEIDSVNRYFM